jgi:GNAT-family acetyltransferase (TIGR03103 family)
MKRPKRARQETHAHRLKRFRSHGPDPVTTGPASEEDGGARAEALIDCGWGRLLFAQTFSDMMSLARAMRAEGADRRDIAFYVHDPHVALAQAPQELFLDPSHTYRLDWENYRPSRRALQGFFIRRLSSESDAMEVNRIFESRSMVPVPPQFFWSRRDSRAITVFVAESETTGAIIGTVMAVDHKRAFNDPEQGSSLWCLAVDGQASEPGIGEALVRRVIEHAQARSANWLDLSVLHDNTDAIALYEKLGFRRIPVFAVKRRNPINERLYTGSDEAFSALNPYARIIVNEALRRGIGVDVTDAEGGFFRLTHGGRAVHCRESLSELTSAVAMSVCDDKRVSRRVVERAGVRVPARADALDAKTLATFLERHGSVVVKPARGEQGNGVAVGLTTLDEIEAAIERAGRICPEVFVEEEVAGMDLRLIVIDFRVVAAAIRKPATIIGDGSSTIARLIERQSRRRAAATGGESTIPDDAETARSIAAAGYDRDSVLDQGVELQVRKTANLHTGGTIHDVTEMVHGQLIDAAIRVARAIDIPVVGVDFMVRDPREPDYAFIEANERPGLANHEPQPTAERFVDLLFPLSMPQSVKSKSLEPAP